MEETDTRIIYSNYFIPGSGGRLSHAETLTTIWHGLSLLILETLINGKGKHRVTRQIEMLRNIGVQQRNSGKRKIRFEEREERDRKDLGKNEVEESKRENITKDYTS